MKKHAAAGLAWVVTAGAAVELGLPTDSAAVPPPRVVPVMPSGNPNIAPPPAPPEEQAVPKVVPVQPRPTPAKVAPQPVEQGPAPSKPPAPPSEPAPQPQEENGVKPLIGNGPSAGSLREPSGRMQVPIAQPPASSQQTERTPQPTSRPTPSPASPASNAEQNQLALADALFSRQQWDGAIPEYQTFLSDYPKSTELPVALYRLAECYLKIGNTNSAKLYFGKLTGLPSPGPVGGAAAYKLAEFEFRDRDFVDAAAHFKLAAQLLPELKAKQSAEYFAARSYQEVGSKIEARALYQKLAEAPERHPFQDASQRELAYLLQEASRGKDALVRFEKLAAQAETPALRAEAIAHAALLQMDANGPKAALPALEAALALKEAEPWHAELNVALFNACVALGDHARVVAAFKAAEPVIQPAQLSTVRLQVANAHKQLQQLAEAIALYSKVIDAAPESTAAGTARYERLVCHYKLGSKNLLAEIDSFLATGPLHSDRDNALLMKAEVLRDRKDFAGAGSVFAEVVKSKDLKAERRNDALMRWAECAVRTGDAQGTVAATTDLLTAAPNYPLASTALFWRAETYRKLKQYAEARRDYESHTKRFQSSPDRETVLKQWALVCGEQDDKAGMTQHFEQLLKEFPQSESAAEAHHWIGRSNFEAKDYKNAVVHLESARKLNPADFFESDSLRLVYCAYSLNDPEQFWARVQEYLPKGKAKIAPDAIRWCATKYIESKDPAKAEPVLALLCSGEEVTENDWLQLAVARQAIQNHQGAIEAVIRYLPLTNHPASKARGLLIRARAELGLGNAVGAQRTVDEALRLQPEGLLNGEARILAGDIQANQKSWEAAAKTYESVSIAFDEEQLAPPAMEKAYNAYRAAGKLKESQSILNKLQSRYPEYAREHSLK